MLCPHVACLRQRSFCIQRASTQPRCLWVTQHAFACKLRASQLLSRTTEIRSPSENESILSFLMNMYLTVLVFTTSSLLTFCSSREFVNISTVRAFQVRQIIRVKRKAKASTLNPEHLNQCENLKPSKTLSARTLNLHFTLGLTP